MGPGYIARGPFILLLPLNLLFYDPLCYYIIPGP